MNSFQIKLTVFLYCLSVVSSVRSEPYVKTSSDLKIISSSITRYRGERLFIEQQNESEIKESFKKIEESLSSGDANALSSYLSIKLYLNFFSGENGYFSLNQTYFILKKFFSEYKVLTFSFSSLSISANNPYGIGQYQYMQHGSKANIQVYISLNHTEHGWRINQITLSQRL